MTTKTCQGFKPLSCCINIIIMILLDKPCCTIALSRMADCLNDNQLILGPFPDVHISAAKTTLISNYKRINPMRLSS
jgi:hypothetical protein